MQTQTQEDQNQPTQTNVNGVVFKLLKTFSGESVTIALINVLQFKAITGDCDHCRQRAENLREELADALERHFDYQRFLAAKEEQDVKPVA